MRWRRHADVFGYDYQGTRQFLRNAADGSQRSSLINPNEQSLEDSKMDSEKLRDINQILNAPKLRKIMDQLRALGGQPIRPLEEEQDIRTNSSTNHQINLGRESLRNDDGLSSGWDRKICIWDLETGQLLDRYQDLKCAVQEMKEIAADGAILDMAYNEDLQVFGLSTHCDGLCRLTLHTGGPVTCFVWEATRGVLIAGVDKDIKTYDLDSGNIYQHYTGHLDVIRSLIMDLLEKYIGHRGEVVCITFRPNPITLSQLGQTGEWISGSDDCTIRVWSTHCDGLCRLTLHTATRGVLIAGVDKDIKTYDLDSGNIYQHYTGHLDVIRSLIVLPEREELTCTNSELTITKQHVTTQTPPPYAGQYISASADGQLRIWRAWTGNTDAVTSKQQTNKSDENILEPMDSMNEALHRAELAASKLSSNPAAAIGAAARAYSAINRIHSTV
ncbi:hypothetical protein AHF37_02226 [Paragonimus kellicotti]|nr:hypothetical protein AHF37_02226 [Paragonimus kellicotti]